MKRLLCGMLLFLLVCACAPAPEKPAMPPHAPHPSEAPANPSSAVPAPNTFVFTRENLPRLDGSTSTAPLAEAVCSVLLGESVVAVADLVQFNKTTTAYYNLLFGRADLLIVGEDNAEILEEKARIGFEWEKSPFATDAFVFVVNEDNPVDSITIDEARRIYMGEITNWRELGGNDTEILPFQRNQDAGSQNLMEKLVMRGLPMMEAPSGFVVSTMGQLMEAVKSYDGSPGAIGYTVYYYAEEMKMAQGLKILALEGVAPNHETIRSEEYPLLNPKYVVIPANAPNDAPNRILYNWLLGEEGQQLVAREGYVAV
ncbi:MAG: substrate-binding domain-containing protein, partial [Clostridiales bacterium]|nr:substrate-binding domain-containing protein [Clostridiales bacterium]